ncbi:glycerol-3-phosphate responsive antiterminator [Pseudodesulfovibrio thermohalotolerans]|uniref:glycerol-3-phosphate responsive antiterminator n=1 Tax=Pseudodesulfovibrio thermohalotolerans TaxID=2880651 RepID=UPI0024423C41|nr:glycerol-3-phosphate responsive antiterminator [Pseudodesulfovibrio thermohalotolerans]WFS60902.1 glycerol-3-phosphate responsive antiterminator [Pseudodesulfovibrio thermohalotolerans]
MKFKTFTKRPIIAAVRTEKEFQLALKSEVSTIFMMGGTVSLVRDLARQAYEADKHIFFHAELVKGLGRDQEGIAFLVEQGPLNGIVSTKPHLLAAARDLGVTTILQIFLIDTQALHTGIRNIESVKPDAVELMPGLVPSIAGQFKALLNVPLFAAGLIRHEHEVRSMLDAGVDALAMSEQRLWNFRNEK